MLVVACRVGVGKTTRQTEAWVGSGGGVDEVVAGQSEESVGGEGQGRVGQGRVSLRTWLAKGVSQSLMFS